MTARDVARGLNQSRAITVCSALTVRCHVHRSKPGIVATRSLHALGEQLLLALTQLTLNLRVSASSQWLTSTVALCRRDGGFLAKIGNFLHGSWVLSAGAPEEIRTPDPRFIFSCSTDRAIRPRSSPIAHEYLASCDCRAIRTECLRKWRARTDSNR